MKNKFKLICLIGIFFLSNNLHGQEVFSITNVIQCEGKNSTELYALIKQWMVNFYAAPGKIIQIDDPDKCYIGCKAVHRYNHDSTPYGGYVDYTLILEARDGRIRYQITNLSHRNIPPKHHTCSLGTIYNTEEQFTTGLNKARHNRHCAKIKEEFNIMSKAMEQTLKDYINSPQSKANDEW